MTRSGRDGVLGGRPAATTRGRLSSVAIELFTADGFDETSVDDIAAAAGIARRTLFRYYPSKNSIAWGEFDEHLDGLRDLLRASPADDPLGVTLRDALIVFNTVPDSERAEHRKRMSLLLGVPALQAHSMIMYADWRRVIAEHCAARLGLTVESHVPQTVAWLTLGTALAAYDQWLLDDDADLTELIGAGSEVLINGVSSLTASPRRSPPTGDGVAL